MKALKIQETIAFKRNQNPHKALGIGDYKERDPEEIKENIFWIWDKYFDNRTKPQSYKGFQYDPVESLIEVGQSTRDGRKVFIFFLDQDTINTELDDIETTQFLKEIDEELALAKYGYEIKKYDVMEIRIYREK